MRASSLSFVIDVRKHQDSGIGTYIRNVVPAVVESLKSGTCGVLADVDASGGFLDGLISRGAAIVPTRALPFSLREQIELRSLLSDGCSFWATALPHPLRWGGGYVATVHDVAPLVPGVRDSMSLPTRLFSRLYYNSIRSTARGVVFNSEFTRAEFERYVGKANGLCAVSGLGVSGDWFSDSSPSGGDGRPYFVCVGNVKPHKNLGALLSAFRLVRTRADCDLVVVGAMDGFMSPDTSTAGSLIVRGEGVRYVGRVSDADLKDLVRRASALVFPSLYEGWGLPALEAMAAGTPVICSDSTSLPDVCGQAARYFDPRVVDSISAAMISHLEAPESVRMRFIAEGRARAASFGWPAVVGATLDVLRVLPGVHLR
jgi:glycosyltransferase involved in cell wall biosynthesis